VFFPATRVISSQLPCNDLPPNSAPTLSEFGKPEWQPFDPHG
jgi:hypothetical protein